MSAFFYLYLTFDLFDPYLFKKNKK